MASSIVSTTIDENFPVAGRDNDSQGFRDNFSVIKNNFAFAKAEIEDLQSGTARLDDDNNFDGNRITEAVLLAVQKETNLTYSNLANTDPALTIPVSYLSGHVHVIKAQANKTINFTDIPTSEYSEIRLFLTANGSPITYSFAAPAGGSIKTDGNVVWTGSTISVTSADNPIIIDICTYNGLTLYFKYVGIFS